MYSITHPTYTKYNFMAYILVENEKKVPLRGKVASSVRLVSDDFKGEVQIVYNNSMFTESKEDGVM